MANHLLDTKHWGVWKLAKLKMVMLEGWQFLCQQREGGTLALQGKKPSHLIVILQCLICDQLAPETQGKTSNNTQPSLFRQKSRSALLKCPPAEGPGGQPQWPREAELWGEHRTRRGRQGGEWQRARGEAWQGRQGGPYGAELLQSVWLPLLQAVSWGVCVCLCVFTYHRCGVCLSVCLFAALPNLIAIMVWIHSSLIFSRLVIHFTLNFLKLCDIIMMF